jgi:uncharacterized protein (DUF952 family)
MTGETIEIAVTPSPKLIFKIVPRAAWEAACLHGRYEGSTDDRRDGFIHLSAPHQVNGTLTKHFKGQKDLIILAFKTSALLDKLKWETSRGGDLFPHFYGALATSAALWSRPLVLGPKDIPICDEAWLNDE